MKRLWKTTVHTLCTRLCTSLLMTSSPAKNVSDDPVAIHYCLCCLLPRRLITQTATVRNHQDTIPIGPPAMVGRCCHNTRYAAVNYFFCCSNARLQLKLQTRICRRKQTHCSDKSYFCSPQEGKTGLKRRNQICSDKIASQHFCKLQTFAWSISNMFFF